MILPDTSLCAIVRDEVINPAGGIIDFVQMTVPYVEEAIIVDTGSIDGTRELLAALEVHYDNLTVIDRTWQGFADARNYAVSHATRKYALHLDADERLFEEDFRMLVPLLQNDSACFSLDFLDVWHDEEKAGPGMRNRITYRLSTEFRGQVFERVYYWNVTGDKKPDTWYLPIQTNIQIKHFQPTTEGNKDKNEIFYGQHYFDTPGLRDSHALCGVADSIEWGGGGYPILAVDVPAPSTIEGYMAWKAFNPRRLDYELSPFLKSLGRGLFISTNQQPREKHA